MRPATETPRIPRVPPAPVTPATGTAWLLVLAALVVGLPVAYLSLYVARGYGFPVGSDAPVYLWWERLAAAEGLSAVRMRPGVPILALVLGGTLGRSQAETLAAVGIVAATAIGLGAAAWVGGRAGRVAGFVAGVLAGTYAADMAGGYYANAVFAAVFVAAIALLLPGGRRRAFGAAGLLGAGAIAHPIFLPPALAILAIAVVPPALRLLRGRDEPGDRDELARVGIAGVGGAAVLGLAILALLAGPDPHPGDTSADAFRRRKGLLDDLGRSYLDRLRRRLARYVLPATVPLAALGLRPAGGLGGRVLASWGAVTVVGLAFAAATGVVPPARFLGFALVLPVGAAFGLPRVWRLVARGIRGRAGLVVAAAVCGGLVVGMVAGAMIPWRRQQPFLSPLEVRRAVAAGEIAASSTQPGTPIVVVVDGAEPVAIPFLVARAQNVVRASVPPERIRDVIVYLGTAERYLAGEPTAIGDAQYDAFSRGLLEDIRATGREPLAFVLAPFARPGFAEARDVGSLAAPGVLRLPSTASSPAAPERESAALPPLAPSTPGGIVTATFLALAMLSAVGFGWARAVAGPGSDAFALAPAFGSAATILAALVLERLGVPLTGSAGPIAVSSLAALGGYGLALVLGFREGRARPQPAP